MKKRIPLDAETLELINEASKCLGFPPSRYFFGPNRTWAVRTALAYARETGIEPNGTVPKSDDSFLKVDTGGLYDDVEVPKLQSILRPVFQRYRGDAMPTSQSLVSRRGTWLSVPQSILAEIAVGAFRSRRTSEVEGVEVLEEAMQRELRDLPEDPNEEETGDVCLRLDPELWEKFRNRASSIGYDADTLLWRRAREVARERRGK